MTPPLAYLNGKLVPFAEAALPLHDAGFVSGATVVDNARTFRHKLFRWPDHLARFRRDCAACYVPLEARDEQLTATAEELVAHNAKLLPVGGELQLVTFATPGPLGFYLGESANGPPTLGMATYPLPFARYRPFFTEGVRLCVAGHQPDAEGAVLQRWWKHRSRMDWHIAQQQLRANAPPDVVALLTDSPNGNITETAFATFMAVIDGALTFPPWGTVLDGISQRVTFELCGTLGIPTTDRPVPVSDVPRMSEAVLTGTGFCIAGVRELHPWGWAGGHSAYRPAWPGPVFRKLLAAWSDLVGVDVEKQFTA
jgi:branched-chain amino acid aminotransferase